ncbi:PTS system transcriptional activator [Carnobacterium maltaromaticum]|uniref:sigma 54-interacting transcriptional regulator n=1 Tax=Carnobacterium maltaromaticum TaxID=2751 RepID=UPI0007050B67|nr:sigma 54-interacting transcriptional regulator [Carnobacterium maltaromaticum]KRN71712.1 hypothetical protein IV76_GL003224 [Carnobacterium maltaromaticum]MBC9808988.1 PRD domain-containing protein [Carnobacterium maltaromaticum]CRH17488.1 PTS system transcriptional activator [Carnobacterium maltaromaticum]
MKRIDKIAELLSSHSENNPITTIEIAKQLNITRANASNDLNILVRHGQANKKGTKPIYFYATEPKIEAPIPTLDTYIKNSPSLFHCGEQAKAAVLYPPKGMHILITGETGVGKSTFAELIFDYAKSEQKVQEDAQFITFNCADYANNPQLLVGQIFGVTKGAYTGALENRIGLLEKADGGILFLDEIHRLPPEGQEILFTFIDKGLYRRLGETNSQQEAKVLLICATTEDTTSTLLQTFIRRIPMRIEIPNLISRDLDERLSLISLFFTEETKKLGAPIEVSTNAIRALLGYVCINNIGQLKADIQLLCAKAYSKFISQTEEVIRISSYELPQFIREGLYNATDRAKIWSLLPNTASRFFQFKEGDSNLILDSKENHSDIYQIIDQKMLDMERIGLNSDQSTEIIETTISNYYQSIIDEPLVDINKIELIVGPEIIATTNKIIEKASRLLNQKMPEQTQYGISLHLFNTIQRVLRGQKIINPRLKDIKAEYPLLFDTALHCLSIIEGDFSIRLPEDEAGFLSFFFMPQKDTEKKQLKANLFVIAHGNTTATSMAEVVNSLLGNSLVTGFNMPIDQKPNDILLEIEDYISKLGPMKDSLLLVDMGSLVNFGLDLEKKFSIQVKTIELASTLHVLEASRKISLGYSLAEVYEATLNVRGLSYYNQSAIEKQKYTDLYILTLCTTGEGSAQLLNNLLNTRLNMRNNHCKILSIQLTDEVLLADTVKKLEASGRIICTIGAFKLSDSYPHFSISAALNEASTAQIQGLIDYEVAYSGMLVNISNMLETIAGPEAIPAIREWLEIVSLELDINLSYEVKIGLICHVVCIIDRLKQGKPVSHFPHSEGFIVQFATEISIIRKNLLLLESFYAIEIPEDEIMYITTFFMKSSLTFVE